MKVSLITTVKDAGDAIEPFLASLAAQSRPPDETIVLDGGSTDGTLEHLREAEGLIVISEPGANIARGRNVAIAAATHDAIAVTDADCVLEPEWLERLLEPLEAGADVAMGYYRPITESFLEACMASVNLPGADEVDPARFMPSSRSVAFLRPAIETAGGYPEWLDIGEDMYVSHRWRQLGLDLRFAPDAVVRWRLRSSLRDTWAQYFRYARGDAIAGMHPERHALRFGVYGLALSAWGTRGVVRKVVTLAAAGAHAAKPVQRAHSSFDDPVRRAGAALAVPALMTFLDAAKMAGYVAGLRRGRHDRQHGPERPDA